MLYGETGRRHLKCTIEKRMINYWLKILAQKDNKITKLLYNYILNMHDNNIQTTAWLDRIKSILDRCGKSDIWLNQREITGTTIVGNQVSQIINDMWLQWWHSEVGARSRCASYCTYKANPQMELYITELQTKDIITFAKFRCRYNHLPIASFTSSKICTLCADGDTGDEYHYLLKCVYFYNERIKLIDVKYAKHPSRHSFSELMNCRKSNELRNLITFINVILQKVKTIN